MKIVADWSTKGSEFRPNNEATNQNINVSLIYTENNYSLQP